jgi:hypothetical protein
MNVSCLSARALDAACSLSVDATKPVDLRGYEPSRLEPRLESPV